MKKAYFIMFLLTTSLLFLIGCQPKGEDEVVTFTGKSNNWSVIFQATSFNDTSEATKFKIQYIGKEEIPKEINYSISSSNLRDLKGTDTLDENGVLEGSGARCNGCMITNKNEEIVSTVEWGKDKETMTLNVSEEAVYMK